MPVKCSVPQGAILGPLLLILFITDIYFSYICLFADDAVIYKYGQKNKRKKYILDVVKIKWFLVFVGLCDSIRIVLVLGLLVVSLDRGYMLFICSALTCEQ